MFDTLFLAKILSAGGIVLGLSLLAERVGPRIAGVLSGAPLGVVMVFFFLGLEVGTAPILASIPHAIGGLTGTLVFVFVYYRSSLIPFRFGIVISPVVSVLAFFGVSWLLSRVPFTQGTALVLTGATALLFGMVFRARIDNLRISWRVRMTPWVIAFRVGLSTFFVVSAISLAKILGPTWTGLLIGFPMTLLPLLIIVHLTYSKEHAHALIRNFPIGVVGLITYLLSVPFTFPAFGVTGGTLASLGVSCLYFLMLPFILRTKRAER
ncbi:MAG: hypothetical protein HN377_00495 [Alphaproteobacteria bacterium]|jgi:hypothetical protein|nr:hypothetical protein [Alphaproteobacteria bacterium]MBT7942662.1 hypothetical protein [Alphaproteobacteria bacterium]